MTYRKGERVFVVGHCGTLGGKEFSGRAFIDELVIIDQDTARSQRAQATVIIHGVTLYRTRDEALRVINAENTGLRTLSPSLWT